MRLRRTGHLSEESSTEKKYLLLLMVEREGGGSPESRTSKALIHHSHVKPCLFVCFCICFVLFFLIPTAQVESQVQCGSAWCGRGRG